MNGNEILKIKDENYKYFDEKSKNSSLFESIIGYDDIKKIFKMSLVSDKPVHILLVGPPASAKTLFMLEFLKLERSKGISFLTSIPLDTSMNLSRLYDFRWKIINLERSGDNNFSLLLHVAKIQVFNCVLRVFCDFVSVSIPVSIILNKDVWSL